MGFRFSEQVVYWFERVSEVIAVVLGMTLVVSLLLKAEDGLVLQQPLDTIEAQYAMSWTFDQPTAYVLPQRVSALIGPQRPDR